jgi:hypothetical protein
LCIFLLGILIFKGPTARRLYKSFGVKGLTWTVDLHNVLYFVLKKNRLAGAHVAVPSATDGTKKYIELVYVPKIKVHDVMFVVSDIT